MNMARYHIQHETVYSYGIPVVLSHQQAHLLPRQVPWQTIERHELTVTPAPSRQSSHQDSFGNPCIIMEFSHPHESLTVTSDMHIQVHDRPSPSMSSMAWEQVVEHCCYTGSTIDEATLEALEFRQESPFVKIKHVFGEYAASCFTPERPIVDAVLALMEKINKEFVFDSEATQIATPLLEVLEKKRGVCQDFAHFMLACLRSIGIPARYVSGYLLTMPPPGQPRLIGADASHAWISAWSPDVGWFDADPTNNIVPGTEHITLAWGRDFSDISPLRGVILGGSRHDLTVRVTVTPENE